MKLKTTSVLHARKPALKDSKGARHLLVWGELAQWLVVDDELASFLELFNGNTLAQIIEKHAARIKKPFELTQREAMPVIAELLRRRILAESLLPFEHPEEPASIANVTINITNRCNLKCSWCYNAAHQSRELPVRELMDALQESKLPIEENAAFIILGGEPFIVRDRLFECLELAEGIFSGHTQVSSNGTLIGPEDVRRLAKRKVHIQISLDSPIEENHDAIRGKGVYQKATDAVRRLRDADVYTLISMVLTKSNVDEIRGYLDLGLELGANEVRFIPMRMIGWGLQNREQAPDLLASFNSIHAIVQEEPEYARLLARDFFSILMTICRFSTPRSGCGIGRRVLFIDSDGKVYPCPNHLSQQHCCGDLAQSSLNEIFQNSPILCKLREQYTVANYSKCSCCAFRHWCAGDCRGEVLAATGNPMAPSPHCAENRELILRMLWLIADGEKTLGTHQELANGQKTSDAFII